VQVWISFATFEVNDAQEPEHARGVFRRAYDHFKSTKSAEERVLVLEAWHQFELALGPDNARNAADVAAKKPRKVKKKRMIEAEDGVRRCACCWLLRWLQRHRRVSASYVVCRVVQSSAGWEDYVDFVFPEDQQGQGNLKLLENAARWRATGMLGSLKVRLPSHSLTHSLALSLSRSLTHTVPPHPFSHFTRAPLFIFSCALERTSAAQGGRRRWRRCSSVHTHDGACGRRR
jgi:hypothetical protein